ncbi:hypothetical protein C9374_005571 [Naegleria lovaniensis]|uniref:HECT-type E3 ubiquitin transferase n=1 Tax=Naegleria lovaniensis TaxID=51637 RepID=A0AA88KI17_NAELO|nr:uncharacterized protein C9374_005571 [Naegleria lovaniensis]KAG2382369.1 hypothetical protein C9374_005571 [Naegleria lovaniensis]
MNFTFTGADSSKKKVSLRGNVKSLTREELLENARRERELSKQNKAQEQAAKLIGKIARKYMIKLKEKNHQRELFDEMAIAKEKPQKVVLSMMNKLLYFYSIHQEKDENRLLICLNFLLRLWRTQPMSINEHLHMLQYNKLTSLIVQYMNNIKDDDFNLATNKRLILASQALITLLDCKYYSVGMYSTLMEKQINARKLIILLIRMMTHSQEKSQQYAANLFATLMNGIKDNAIMIGKLVLELFSHPMIFSSLSETTVALIDAQTVIWGIGNEATNLFDDKRKLFFCGNLIQFMNKHMKSLLSSEVLIQYLRIVATLLPDVDFDLIAIEDNSSAMTDDKEVEEIPSGVKQQVQLIFKKNHLKKLIEAMVSSELAFRIAIFKDFAKLFLYLMHEETKHTTLILGLLSYCTDNYSLINSMWSLIKGDLLDNVEILALFCKVYDNVLSFIDDEEFKSKPFTYEENINISGALKPIAFELVWTASKSSLKEDVCNVLTKIHNRDVRLKFCPFNHFIVDEASSIDISKIAEFMYQGNDMTDDEEPRRDPYEYIPIRLHRVQALKEALSHKSSFKETQAFNKTRELISKLPFMVPIHVRIRIFKEILTLDKDYCQQLQHFIEPIEIHRDRIFEDSYSKFYPLSALQLKGRIRVQFSGEAGIGEGVMREYIFELCKLAYSTSYGLFKSTDDGHLYPNPYSHLIYPEGQDLRFYTFLGKILGKAIYDGIMIDLPLAKFFISKLMKGSNSDLINDLYSYDKELYKNLLYLKNNNLGDLGLNFTVVEGDEMSATRVIPLIPNGENIEVNEKNKYSFIYRMANYKLNHQIKNQSESFMKGLNDIIPASWLALFDENELIDIISGSDSPIDIDDMYANTEYGPGYDQEHPTIQLFWDIVFNDLTPQQHVLLLKFISSISRPPLLGFKDLHPKICIHKVADTSRLPTSSTCYSLLKLPAYTSRQQLKEKLIQAIEQGTQTFGLT